MMNNKMMVFDSQTADVNGDGIADTVSIVGKKASDELVISDIALNIIDGRTRKRYVVPLKTNRGYNPKIFLGSFAKNSTAAILVTIELGNTGREEYFYIYSFLNNDAVKLYDYINFNNENKYDVIYEDNYLVKVINKSNNQQYSISIANRGKDYLFSLYNNDGTLKKPTRGMVSSVVEISPIANAQNYYDIYATQRVIGYYNADTLGTIVTTLNLNA